MTFTDKEEENSERGEFWRVPNRKGRAGNWK